MAKKWKKSVLCISGAVVLLAVGFGSSGFVVHQSGIQTIQIWFENDIDERRCETIIEENGGKIISEKNAVGMYTVEVNTFGRSGAKGLCHKLEKYKEVESALWLDTSIEAEIQKN